MKFSAFDCVCVAGVVDVLGEGLDVAGEDEFGAVVDVVSDGVAVAGIGGDVEYAAVVGENEEVAGIAADAFCDGADFVG
ncbi:hypothetical protein ES703_100691 [subsurface metagenome]